MSARERVTMVAAGSGLSAGLLGLFLTAEDHPNPIPWVITAGVATGLLLTFALWPRR